MGDIGRGLCASSRRHRLMTRYINQGLYASVVACSQRQRNISHGIRASAKRRGLMAGRISQVFHTSYMVCTSRKRRRTTTCIINHGLNISLVVCVHQLGEINIGQLQEPSTMACALHASDIRQRLEPSAKACTHLTRHVCIYQAPLSNGM